MIICPTDKRLNANVLNMPKRTVQSIFLPIQNQ